MTTRKLISVAYSCGLFAGVGAATIGIALSRNSLADPSSFFLCTFGILVLAAAIFDTIMQVLEKKGKIP